MRYYSVDYDLSAPGRNYERLRKSIESYPNWCHALESHSIVASSRTAVEVRDHLKLSIDANDKILVAELTGVAAWNNLGRPVSEWLKSVPARSLV